MSEPGKNPIALPTNLVGDKCVESGRNIDELKALAFTLKLLLDSPEPGLYTWRYAVADLCVKIGEFGL